MSGTSITNFPLFSEPKRDNKNPHEHTKSTTTLESIFTDHTSHEEHEKNKGQIFYRARMIRFELYLVYELFSTNKSSTPPQIKTLFLGCCLGPETTKKNSGTPSGLCFGSNGLQEEF